MRASQMLMPKNAASAASPAKASRSPSWRTARSSPLQSAKAMRKPEPVCRTM